ncbi:MAG: hypothetical protein PPP56_08990 [Longimonas sp.]|uniref:hypothetical protein n=1 Tax=Longimonas sp. TaxID=2039626 RepID=UPI00334C52A2
MLCASVIGVVSAQAQHSGQTQRAFVPSVEALGRGDGAAALPGSSNPLFYNPAHLATRPPSLTAFRLHGSGSGHVADQFRLMARGQPGTALNGDLEAYEAGFEALSDTVRSVGTRPSIFETTLALPSGIYRAGAYAFSAGAYVHGSINQRFEETPARIPRANHTSRTDAMFLVAVGYDASAYVSGLSAGLTLKATRRYVSFLDTRIDALSPDDKMPVLDATPMIGRLAIFDGRADQNPVWAGSSVGMDLGVLYTVQTLDLPGELHVGATVFDLFASRFGFTLHDDALSIPIVGAFLPDQPAYVTNGNVDVPDTLPADAADRFQPHASVRIGAAYTVDSFSVLDNIGVTLDYQEYRHPRVRQPVATRFHLGAEAQYDILIARLGLNQGYPTAGVGLRMGHIHVDYAFYGREEGTSFRETYNHVNTLQMALRF